VVSWETVPYIDNRTVKKNVLINATSRLEQFVQGGPKMAPLCTLPCEMSSVLKATIENKTTSVITHFKKLTTGNNVFIVSVIV